MKSCHQRTTKSLKARQRGVALFISLVLLLVLTIIGVSAVQTTSLEVRMARNEHDSLLAFQAAEAALIAAEQRIESLVLVSDFGGTGEYTAIVNFGDQPRHLNPDIWTGGNSVVANVVDGVAEAPRYFIEELAEATPVNQDTNLTLGNTGGNSISGSTLQVYRITARGIGGTPNAQVVLQSTYVRGF